MPLHSPSVCRSTLCRGVRRVYYVMCFVRTFYTLPPPRVHFAGRFLPIFYLALPPDARQRERPLGNTCEHLLHCRLNCCCLRFPFCEILVSVTGDLRKVRHLTRISFRRHSTPVSLLISHYAGSRARDIDAGRPANRCWRKKEERCSCLTTIDRFHGTFHCLDFGGRTNFLLTAARIAGIC